MQSSTKSQQIVFLLGLAVMALFIQTCAGNSLCYECRNQPSEQACLETGQLSLCDVNESYCQTVVRFHDQWQHGLWITKRCKQKKACENNHDQNPGVCRHWEPDTTCYCCCFGDRCNNDAENCWKNNVTATEAPTTHSPSTKAEAKCEDLLGPNSEITCTDENNLDSVCFITSLLDETIRKRCVMDNSGVFEWQNEIFETVKDEGLQCPLLLEPKENSFAVGCTDDINLASVCTFQCDPGYFMTSSPMIECVINEEIGIALWDRETPSCERITCEPRFEPSEGLIGDCTNDNNHGSVCTFSCEEGYALVPAGNDIVECGDDNQDGIGNWNKEFPTCRPITCEPAMNALATPGMSGSCTNSNFYGSVCTCACDVGYVLTPETSAEVTCLDDNGVGAWSSPPPTCEPLSCDPFEVENAQLICDNEFVVNSTCTVQCNDPNHVVYPKSFQYVTCMTSQAWSDEAPCCTAPCPENALMDMVIVLDSSSTINPKTWQNMIDFVLLLVNRFNVGPKSTNFAVFRYTNEVDTDTQIKLDDHDDNESLNSAINKIPHNGMGTYTGIALGHAAEVMLSEENGNREYTHDLVVVVTDGQANRRDDVLPPAEKLADMGATVMAIGVDSSKFAGLYFTLDELHSITGNPDQVFVAQRGNLAAVIDRLHAAIEEKVCQDVCKRAKYYMR